MTDERKSLRDGLFKVLSSLGNAAPEVKIETGGSSDDEDEVDDDSSGRPLLDPSAARALISALFQRAGKGKDEVVQIVAREIGVAVAAMLKEPLSQLAKHQKLQISFEFVPKNPKARERHDRQQRAHHEDHAESDEHDEADGEDHDKKPLRRRPTKRSSHRKKAAIGD